MFRILLPLIFAGVLLFAPLYNYESTDDYTGEVTQSSRSASDVFFPGALDCAMNMQFDPRVEGCGPNEKRGMLGWAFYASAASSVVAGVLGVLGLLPLIGRLTSMVTTAAGGIGTGTIGFFLFDLWQSGKIEDLAFGGWVAGALALFTLVAGFTGISGDDD